MLCCGVSCCRSGAPQSTTRQLPSCWAQWIQVGINTRPSLPLPLLPPPPPSPSPLSLALHALPRPPLFPRPSPLSLSRPLPPLPPPSAPLPLPPNAAHPQNPARTFLSFTLRLAPSLPPSPLCPLYCAHHPQKPLAFKAVQCTPTHPTDPSMQFEEGLGTLPLSSPSPLPLTSVLPTNCHTLPPSPQTPAWICQQ